MRDVAAAHPSAAAAGADMVTCVPCTVHESTVVYTTSSPTTRFTRHIGFAFPFTVQHAIQPGVAIATSPVPAAASPTVKATETFS